MVRLARKDSWEVYGAHDQLLCSSVDEDKYFLVDYRSGIVTELSALSGAIGLTYISSKDSILYSKTRGRALGGETADLFLYDLDSNEAKLLIENTRIATGIWIEEVPEFTLVE